jgi:hypothetical protein
MRVAAVAAASVAPGPWATETSSADDQAKRACWHSVGGYGLHMGPRTLDEAQATCVRHSPDWGGLATCLRRKLGEEQAKPCLRTFGWAQGRPFPRTPGLGPARLYLGNPGGKGQETRALADVACYCLAVGHVVVGIGVRNEIPNILRVIRGYVANPSRWERGSTLCLVACTAL